MPCLLPPSTNPLADHERHAAPYESFLAGELWAEVVAEASVLDLTSNDFAVMNGSTSTTQPGMKVL